jgi:hypothetical protein
MDFNMSSIYLDDTEELTMFIKQILQRKVPDEVIERRKKGLCIKCGINSGDVCLDCLNKDISHLITRGKK